MGLLSWLTGDGTTDSESTPIKAFDPDAVPYGLNKRAGDCTVEDIRRSNDLVRDAHEDSFRQAGLLYELTTALDYKSTPLELALHGCTAPSCDELPLVPYGETGCRVMEVLIDPDDRAGRTFGKVVAETQEELEKFPQAGLYKTKTRRKETGKCYFVANFWVKSKPGKTAGAYLKRINHLTRTLILGDELTADFEAAMKQKMDPQDWIDDRLGHLRQPR